MNHQKRRNRQPFISFGVVVLVLLILKLTLFAILKIFMPESAEDIPDMELTATEKKLAERLEEDVYALSAELGERNMHRRGSMEQAAEWVVNRMKEIGYSPERQTYRIPDGQYAGEAADNLVAEVAGTSNPAKIVVIGAHYDSVYGSPGANDNASAVATLLALAEWFKERPQPLTVRFVAFANEEPPFFHTRNMGSYAYAQNCRELGEQIVAMMSMDGLGFYSDEPRSQHYPVPGLGFLYPDTADFIGFVTRLSDRSLLNRVLGAFRENATIASEGATLPGFIPGVFWSDHWSFWKHDYPAFLVTDTLLFRDPYYHTPADTTERLDYESMARVAEGLKAVIEEMAKSGP